MNWSEPVVRCLLLDPGHDGLGAVAAVVRIDATPSPMRKSATALTALHEATPEQGIASEGGYAVKPIVETKDRASGNHAALT
jgi:hypothetical protein